MLAAADSRPTPGAATPYGRGMAVKSSTALSAILLGAGTLHGLEGVVAKCVDSTYRPGRRAPTWIKTPLRNNTEAIVIGWVDGAGTARDGVGSLLLGAYDDDRRLVYIGHVGTGFTTAGRRALRQQLTQIERTTSPLTAAALEGADPRNHPAGTLHTPRPGHDITPGQGLKP